jgi:hypothetical protein
LKSATGDADPHGGTDMEIGVVLLKVVAILVIVLMRYEMKKYRQD